MFTLVVDDFGVKYESQEHLNHLLSALKEDYAIKVDREGKLYCGILLDWNHDKSCFGISMPGYVKKQLTHYVHSPQTAGDTPPTIQYQ